MSQVTWLGSMVAPRAGWEPQPFPTDRRSIVLIVRAFLDLLRYRVEGKAHHEADDDPPCCLQEFDVFARDLLRVANEEQDGIQLVGINSEADAEVFDEILEVLQNLVPQVPPGSGQHLVELIRWPCLRPPPRPIS